MILLNILRTNHDDDFVRDDLLVVDAVNKGLAEGNLLDRAHVESVHIIPPW